ncbi:MAG: hypothetical protein ABEK16_04035 [Candidatus Nanohalobium sp.]
MSLAPVQTAKPREEKIRERVFQVAEDYGLDIEQELDEVGVKYLGTYVNARTSKAGSKLRIDFDFRNFFKQSEEEQRRTILHELIHVKQFNNSLDEWAQDEFDVSDRFAEKLDGTIWEGVKSVEGETELILSSFFPEENSSYPYAESSKERELDSLGLDIDSEITDEIEDEAEEILDEYREIDNIEIEENSYLEEGSIGDFDYSVAVMGEDAPEKGPRQVEDYLTGEIEKGVDYGPSVASDYLEESAVF